MEEFFDDDEPVFKYSEKVLAFIKEGRRRGYDRFFRIGISMSTLMLSKQKEELRSGDPHVALTLLGGKLTVECDNFPAVGFVQDEIFFSERVIALFELFKSTDC